MCRFSAKFRHKAIFVSSYPMRTCSASTPLQRWRKPSSQLMYSFTFQYWALFTVYFQPSYSSSLLYTFLHKLNPINMSQWTLPKYRFTFTFLDFTWFSCEMYCMLTWNLFRLGKLRTNLWNIMEYPETSKTAQVYVSIKTGSVQKAEVWVLYMSFKKLFPWKSSEI